MEQWRLDGSTQNSIYQWRQTGCLVFNGSNNKLLSLKEVIKSYHVTYNSYDNAFIVWRESQNLPNMVVKMHHSGLHFYNPKNNGFSFVITVANDMKMFSKWQIVGAEKVKSLQAGHAFPSNYDMKWIFPQMPCDHQRCWHYHKEFLVQTLLH